MPFRITYDGPLIELHLFGTLTGADLAGAMEELEKLEDTLARLPDRMTDLSAVDTSKTSFPIVFELAERRRERAFVNGFRSAIVAPTPVSFGYARMYQTLNDSPQVEVRIFNSREPAMAWLMGDLHRPR